MRLFKKAPLILIILIALIAIYCPIPNSEIDTKLTQTYNILYLDRQFSDDEKLLIISAALEWNIRTKNFIRFEVVMLPTDTMYVSNGVIISPISEDSPHLLNLDLFNNRSTLGYFSRKAIIPYIAIVSGRVPPQIYKSVVLHELGHVLGLEHNLGWWGINTLMFPSADFGADHITNLDIINLCNIHNCDSNFLNDQQKLFHP